jgi:hypothetical protein
VVRGPDSGLVLGLAPLRRFPAHGGKRALDQRAGLAGFCDHLRRNNPAGSRSTPYGGSDDRLPGRRSP